MMDKIIWRTTMIEGRKVKVSNNGDLIGVGGGLMTWYWGKQISPHTKINNASFTQDFLVKRVFNNHELTLEMLILLDLCELNRVRGENNPKKRKKSCLVFVEKHGRMPSRYSHDDYERKLASAIGNYTSKASLSYDAEFSKLLLETTPKMSNDKAPHNPEKRKQELLDFVRLNRRTPSVRIEGESKLWGYLNYYCGPSNREKEENISLFEEICNIDKCYRTNIAKKFRRSINEALGKEPLEVE